MVDEAQPGGGSTASICPWCSASYTGTPDSCPSCGATLEAETVDPSLPGVTAIDAAAIVRSKTPTPRSRNRLLSWISGEYPDEAGSPGDTAALAAPDLEVRREMLRLELEAEVANLQAEAEALRAEAIIEGRAPDATPRDAAAAEAVVAELDAIEGSLETVDAQLDKAPLSPEPDAPDDAQGGADEPRDAAAGA